MSPKPLKQSTLTKLKSVKSSTKCRVCKKEMRVGVSYISRQSHYAGTRAKTSTTLYHSKCAKEKGLI